MLRRSVSYVAAASVLVFAPMIFAQSQPGRSAAPAAPGPAATDVYHVHFDKALPGQARALADQLVKQDPKAPMQGHFLVLRHQDGDDWDYCVIEHEGAKATVEIGPAPAPGAPPVSAWHEDTFVAGPPWNEFARTMGVGVANTASSVYEVATWRQAPGHRAQLQQALMRTDPASKIKIGFVLMQHLEGAAWTFLAINRYNSWQDYAADQAATGPKTGTGSDVWSQVREHSSFHRDTLADRIAPK